MNVIRARAGAAPAIPWRRLLGLLRAPGVRDRIRALTGNTQIPATRIDPLAPARRSLTPAPGRRENCLAPRDASAEDLGARSTRASARRPFPRESRAGVHPQPAQPQGIGSERRRLAASRGSARPIVVIGFRIPTADRVGSRPPLSPEAHHEFPSQGGPRGLRFLGIRFGGLLAGPLFPRQPQPRGRCCSPVVPNLPPFPPFTLHGQGNCIKDCTPGNPFDVQIHFESPGQVFCDTFVIPITITGGFVNIAPQLLIAKYARTWTEMSATGGLVQQVWRFLVNGDLVYTVAPGAPSPARFPRLRCRGRRSTSSAPSTTRAIAKRESSRRASIWCICAESSRTVHSARRRSPPIPIPTSTTRSSAPRPLCGSRRAARRDRDRRIGPQHAGRPHGDPGIVAMPVGGAGPPGALDNVALYCPCADPTVPPGTSPWTEQKLTFAYGACMPTSPFTFMALPFPTLAPTGFSVMSLGTHALPITTFPDSRSVHFYFAVGSAPDPCVTGALPIHIINGVSTVGPLIGIGTPPPPASPSRATRSSTSRTRS